MHIVPPDNLTKVLVVRCPPLRVSHAPDWTGLLGWCVMNVQICFLQRIFTEGVHSVAPSIVPPSLLASYFRRPFILQGGLKYSPPERPELRGDSARTCTGLVASNRHSIGGCGHQHLFGSGVSVTQASSARILSMSERCAAFL